MREVLWGVPEAAAEDSVPPGGLGRWRGLGNGASAKPDPSVQGHHRSAAAGDTGTPGNPRRGHLTVGLVPALRCCRRLKAAGPVARETPPEQTPLNPAPAAPALRFRCCWGIPWPPAGQAEGEGKGGVCRNELGRSRLLETNFTNDFCNN